MILRYTFFLLSIHLSLVPLLAASAIIQPGTNETSVVFPYYNSTPVPPSFVPLDNVTAPSTNAVSINCHGSFYCPWLNLPANHILSFLLRWMTADLDDGAVYGPGANIACACLWTSNAAFCTFTQGNVSMPSVSGRMAKSRIVQLMGHGCFACESVSFGEGKGEDMGILTVDYVSHAVCNGRPGAGGL
ncbi:hypothetical protein OEA41_000073 [Lepraria neglecta]|uniref:Killer toxin Kp4 domain-containing protein n=1 Tax=Lepraria neglecta TaxID=209136 RepID=A0AAE0DP52_9LECA|nr:hypothetical protein OEA41_000073 [Lepraria neglecta]